MPFSRWIGARRGGRGTRRVATTSRRWRGPTWLPIEIHRWFLLRWILYQLATLIQCQVAGLSKKSSGLLLVNTSSDLWLWLETYLCWVRTWNDHQFAEMAGVMLCSGVRSNSRADPESWMRICLGRIFWEFQLNSCRRNSRHCLTRWWSWPCFTEVRAQWKRYPWELKGGTHTHRAVSWILYGTFATTYSFVYLVPSKARYKVQRKIIFTQWIRNAPGRKIDVSCRFKRKNLRAKGNVELKKSRCNCLVIQGIPWH